MMDTPMKILYLGDIGPGQTCLMRMRALQRLGHQVVGVNTVQPWRQAKWLQRQLQRRLHRGSVVDAINESVLAGAAELQPDLVWADKQEFLRPDTLQKLRESGARLVSFTPDPYFTLSWKRTPLMDAAMQEFDAFVYCKSYEKKAYEATGKEVIYMPLGYCDEVHRPLVSADSRWQCEIGFLGGWEPRRERYLNRVAVAGNDLKVWGGYWDFLNDGRRTFRRSIILRQLAGNESFKIHRNPALGACLQGDEVYGDDYARALTGAKISVGFLRKVCPDQHTTRTFEIPACGSMLLADRTEEHQEFFKEGQEADYFGSEDELVDKIAFYVKNPEVRERVALAGIKRSHDGGYSYLERMRALFVTASFGSK